MLGGAQLRVVLERLPVVLHLALIDDPRNALSLSTIASEGRRKMVITGRSRRRSGDGLFLHRQLENADDSGEPIRLMTQALRGRGTLFDQSGRSKRRSAAGWTPAA